MQAPPKTRPAVIGLTGAIAAGKSSALGALERLGARTLSSDETVHELLTDPEVAAILHERWGEGAVPDGEVDRRRIGSIVFSDPAELAWLEGVLHPRVGERTQRWRSELPAGTELAVVEVPLLFEAGLESSFDATLVIAASDELRAERAGARGTGELAGREARQLGQAAKLERASFVVRNDGTPDELEAALGELWPLLREASSSDGR